MSNLNDRVKREEWRRRLERFEAGDLSIAQFCRDEGVGTHTFYYWSKQLGRKSEPERSVANGHEKSTFSADAVSCQYDEIGGCYAVGTGHPLYLGLATFLFLPG